MLTLRSSNWMALACMLAALRQISCQLPDDIQRELNQNLAEQARIEAMRQQHQKQIQSRTGGQRGSTSTSSAGHDPNNYSYQQVSPPIQYSYYQPYGDAAQTQTSTNQPRSGQTVTPVSFDLNNLNFDIPQQAATTERPATSSVHNSYKPSFTGAGGLPVLQPVNPEPYVPHGNAPLPPQARVQQGPPLTEADFKDITGGENYGAPSGDDFGLGQATSGGTASNKRSDADSDAQLKEFGLSGEPSRQFGGSNLGANQMNIPDFGAFNTLGGGQAGSRSRSDPDFGANFGNFGSTNAPSNAGGPSANVGEFDFTGQPSNAGQGDQAVSSEAGAAPRSLQGLLGNSFPGLEGSKSNGLDEFAKGGNNQQMGVTTKTARADDGAMEVADLGDKSDQFSSADLGGFEQPNPSNDQDFNYAAAASNQPKTVLYPDDAPQLVGSIIALTQPSSLTQTRFSAFPDKGTYQDYPGYSAGGNNFKAVRKVVSKTPKPRAEGPGRYGIPSPNDLAPEYKATGKRFDYNNGPTPKKTSTDKESTETTNSV